MDKKLLIQYLETSAKVEEIARSFPLAVSQLWEPHCCRWDGRAGQSERLRGCGGKMNEIQNGMYHCPTCNITEHRTSQRRAILSLGSEATLISGGNRSGKSEAGCMLAVATAAGRGEWWVREWLRLNNLPDDLVPAEPSEVWVSALSYGDALTYLRPKIEKYCPANARYIRWRAQDRASVLFPNGGKILSMSADAGREKFQGGAVSLVVLDEEHPQPIFDESMLRCIDNRGRVVLTMTPLLGITWPHDIFFENPQNGYTQYAISGLDNPWISSVKLRKAIAHMSEESQRTRLFGDFTNQQGVVYPEFKRAIHVVDSFDPPAHWPRDRSIDFGVRNPFACLYFAHDEEDDVLHVYDEYYATERTTVENGRILNNRDPSSRFRWTVADPESRDGRLTLSRECSIETRTAPKHIGVVETINWVKERLALDAEGRPHLVIHSNCKNLLREFRLYRWKGGGGKDAPQKKDDHALDALRYQVAFLKRYLMHQ
tara:strand:+ start:790 stop:2247 length:1458 start_codon:yes stop_codon:yes gene_type:complete